MQRNSETIGERTGDGELSIALNIQCGEWRIRQNVSAMAVEVLQEFARDWGWAVRKGELDSTAQHRHRSNVATIKFGVFTFWCGEICKRGGRRSQASKQIREESFLLSFLRFSHAELCRWSPAFYAFSKSLIKILCVWKQLRSPSHHLSSPHTLTLSQLKRIWKA